MFKIAKVGNLDFKMKVCTKIQVGWKTTKERKKAFKTQGWFFLAHSSAKGVANCYNPL